jgi:hypothetical protein
MTDSIYFVTLIPFPALSNDSVLCLSRRDTVILQELRVAENGTQFTPIQSVMSVLVLAFSLPSQ